MRLASQAFKGDMIAAGVEVLQFEGGLLHTKSELTAMDHPWGEAEENSDAQSVPEGTAPLLDVENLTVDVV